MKEITTSAATAVPVGSKSKKTEASPEVFSLLMQQLTEQTASNLPASFEPSGMTEQTATAPEMGIASSMEHLPQEPEITPAVEQPATTQALGMSQISQAPFAGLVQEALQASMATTEQNQTSATAASLDSVSAAFPAPIDVATTVINPSEPALEDLALMTNDRSEAAATTLETPLPEDLVGEEQSTAKGIATFKEIDSVTKAAIAQTTEAQLKQSTEGTAQLGQTGPLDQVPPVTNQATDTTSTLQRTNEIVAKKAEAVSAQAIASSAVTDNEMAAPALQLLDVSPLLTKQGPTPTKASMEQAVLPLAKATAQLVQTSSTASEKKITLQFVPEKLGTIQLSLETNAQGSRLELTVQQPQAKELLLSIKHELEQVLQKQEQPILAIKEPTLTSVQQASSLSNQSFAGSMMASDSQLNQQRFLQAQKGQSKKPFHQSNTAEEEPQLAPIDHAISILV
ncbi:MAG: flagellar hook-length control protein FliK [Enterococcus casseliflavus]|uniref:flagellar hook-length control protein FliK n=1 Tax=Enterococcus casseliflavus TaxID=37734 RepID=UPI000EB4485B|nr:flagellar hook-length control protein FliK [Enterococcus casseliflavus]AYJ44187.1 flagellar hook-length control protein FliK [Enterococcus casseliflavus]MBS5813195.1 flagellar hook-length control protein FliK [Enterococcus casseliflavus]MDU3372340.1 flagellar hook-length control protein FliK [Enterococcus casseliflavus]